MQPDFGDVHIVYLYLFMVVFRIFGFFVLFDFFLGFCFRFVFVSGCVLCIALCSMCVCVCIFKCHYRITYSFVCDDGFGFILC